MNHALYTKLLLIPYILFIVRVSIQLIQYFVPLGWLPAFESWHTDTIPYGILLISQIIIISIFSLTIWRISLNKITPHNITGKFLLSLGIIYFIFMLFRLVGGLTFLVDNSWFAQFLPAFFHLVLASFIIIWGCFHLRIGHSK